ncbi:MAG: demethoxyubiquinone hydroxylase family protein, partial [Proteobacteria bacterium]|nr:demethoxyubiquinone hydroxylase family protein [Pseudomonadota bacterium]
IGAIPALISDQWVYATIEAVETFVDEHYQLQLDRLSQELPHHPVRAILARCQADEIAHKRDAATRLEAASSVAQSKALGLWRQTVDLGSRAAVVVARAI